MAAGMRRNLTGLLRRAAGTTGLGERLDALRGEMLGRIEALRADLARQAPPPAPAPAAPGLEVLPANAYARYALPMEYPPSRDLRPRWGYTHPLIGPLAEWMGRHDEDYRAVLRGMRDAAPILRRINLDFDHARLPEPGWRGTPYAPFDAAVLHAMIGRHRPRLYLEIGSGSTTAVARRAARDHGLATRIVSIDPEPRAAIDALCDEVIRAGLETCDLAVFDRLQPGDVLFLDGSHRVFMNSDVTVFMLDVLPRLAPGVVVHVHDIHLPWDYPDMFTPWYWSEAYILAAWIMAAPDRVRPLMPTAWVCRAPQFADWFAAGPLVDLGAENEGWRGGGALWFTRLAAQG